MSMTIRTSRSLLLAAVVCVIGSDWRQFRGTDSTGVARQESVPQQFGPDENVAWKAEIPGRGPSSPIVVGHHVIVTASSGTKQDRLHVLAFDAATGKKLWQRNFWATGPTAAHPKSSMAAPTPASDGKHVIALFATNDLFCLDLDGNVLWIRSLYEENPGATDGRGLASSPLVVGSTVIVHVENQNTSFAAGIDVATGQNKWRIDRPRELCWSSPIAVPGQKSGSELALLQGSSRLSAVEPATGREVWGIDRSSDPISSSVLEGSVLLVPGEKGLTAFELQRDGSQPKVLWEKPKLNPSTASPILVDGRLYALRGAILSSADLKTGELKGQTRLKGAFSASPIAAGGLIYCFSEDGTGQVVKPGEKEDTVVANCKMGETVLGTPAIANGAIYIRTEKRLWKVAKPG